ncbi:MAG TPA: DMT family transporter, partial [Alkalispirochaeta sp.]|nr:DMT family transporter [Alkalispirochaeta sp.]
VPPMTAVLGWLILGERLTPIQGVAMVLTVAGIMTVTTARAPRPIGNAMPYPRRIRGVWFAVVGALGQAGGLVLSRYGAPTYDAFGATQIRTVAGILGFVVLFFITRRWRLVGAALHDRTALRHIGRGAFFGPFLGVSMGLVAAQRAGTGVAATIIATVPVLLIPVAIVYFKERVTPREVLGSVIAVTGVGLLFLA